MTNYLPLLLTSRNDYKTKENKEKSIFFQQKQLVRAYCMIFQPKMNYGAIHNICFGTKCLIPYTYLYFFNTCNFFKFFKVNMIIVSWSFLSKLLFQVYSRLTPPSAWHRKTVDKILIIGNLLYRECICCTTTEEVKLENIPAIFTVGPYIVEIYIFGNVFADVIYRSCVCQLQTCLDSFFTKCTNAILQFGKI